MGYLREDDIKDITEHVLRRKDFYKKFVFLSYSFFCCYYWTSTRILRFNVFCSVNTNILNCCLVKFFLL